VAHGDYACCACCDVKMYYDACSEEVKTKLCGSCAASLSIAAGTPVTSGADVVAWVQRDRESAMAALHANGYHVCFYSNAVDGAVKAAFTKEVSDAT